MAVRIRMKKMGRKHRAFFRICVMDSRVQRDGKTIEEVGFYEPMVHDKAARVKLNMERVDYWMSVGAQPSEKVNALIRKVKMNKFGKAQAPPAQLAPKVKEVAAAEAAEEAPAETVEAAAAEEYSMRFDILSLFPEMFESYLGQGHLKLAIERGLVDIQRHNFREFAPGIRRQVDDKPFGGGPGMLLMCQPVFDCVEAVQIQGNGPGRLLMLTPQGRKMDQRLVEELAQESRLLLLCGRYEGFDDRIRQGLQPTEISVGDFICNGGEVPAMLIIDAVIRLIPGVLGDETSSRYDSFSASGLLEHPQFTRPREFRGMTVPDVLVSGDHKKIMEWELDQSLQRTAERRRDLLDTSDANAAQSE